MEPTTPKLVEAPLKPPRDTVAEAKAYTQELMARLGAEGIIKLESKLPHIEAKPGWTRRWCNDDGDNIPRKLADGWRFVSAKEASMSASLGYTNADVADQVAIISNIGAGPIKVILMELPTEMVETILDVRYYSKARATEAAILGGALGDTTNRYIPGDEKGSAFFGTRNKVSKPVAIQ